MGSVAALLWAAFFSAEGGCVALLLRDCCGLAGVNARHPFFNGACSSTADWFMEVCAKAATHALGCPPGSLAVIDQCVVESDQGPVLIMAPLCCAFAAMLPPCQAVPPTHVTMGEIQKQPELVTGDQYSFSFTMDSKSQADSKSAASPATHPLQPLPNTTACRLHTLLPAEHQHALPATAAGMRPLRGDRFLPLAHKACKEGGRCESTDSNSQSNQHREHIMRYVTGMQAGS